MERSRDKGTKKRSRIVFDVDSKLADAANSAAEKLNIPPRQFYIDAIKEAIQPGIRFHTPLLPNEIPLEAFLEQSNEIVMLGISLTSLHQESMLSFLRQKIVRDKVPMTFLTIHPDLADDDPVFTILKKRYAPVYGPDGLRVALQKTRAVLYQLHQTALEVHQPIRVLGMREFPVAGLALVNPNRHDCRMRVAPYLYAYPNEPQPFLEIDMATDRGRDAGYAFLRHLDRVYQVAQLIDLSSESTDTGR